MMRIKESNDRQNTLRVQQQATNGLHREPVTKLGSSGITTVLISGRGFLRRRHCDRDSTMIRSYLGPALYLFTYFCSVYPQQNHGLFYTSVK
jgi:hypothetical protein